MQEIFRQLEFDLGVAWLVYFYSFINRFDPVLPKELVSKYILLSVAFENRDATVFGDEQRFVRR